MGRESPAFPERTKRRNTMALLERVSTLLRANVNDLIDKARRIPRSDAPSTASRYGKSTPSGKNASRHRNRRSASAGEESERARRDRAVLAPQGRTCRLQGARRSGARAALDRSLSHQQLFWRASRNRLRTTLGGGNHAHQLRQATAETKRDRKPDAKF